MQTTLQTSIIKKFMNAEEFDVFMEKYLSISKKFRAKWIPSLEEKNMVLGGASMAEMKAYWGLKDDTSVYRKMGIVLTASRDILKGMEL